MDIRFDGKTVLITGASSGIGLACARLFGQLGACVAICGTNAQKLAAAESSLRQDGITVLAQICHVEDEASLRAFADSVMDRFGRIDVWVSNAGIYPQYSIIDMDEQMWERTFSVNTKAVYLGARLAYRCMKDRGGVILIASSFAAVFPSVGSGAYAASKSAATSMIRSLAAELAPYGIRVNGYIPGVIDTDMTRQLTETNGEAMRAAIALQQFGKPEDVAYAAAFLASDYARYITGATLEVTGGKMGVQNPGKAWTDKRSRP